MTNAQQTITAAEALRAFVLKGENIYTVPAPTVEQRRAAAIKAL